MTYIEKIFERATVKGITDYLLYQEKTYQDDKDYETRLEEAFKVFEEIVLTYDSNKESKLINVMNEFASDITDIYMEIGLQAGFLIMLDMMKKTKR